VTRMMAATTSGEGASANEPEARVVQFSSRRVCIRSRERPKFVHEADLREELRVTCGSLLEPGHADEHHAETALVEHRTELFEARHGVPVGFINDDGQSGIGSLLRFVLFEGLEVSGGRLLRKRDPKTFIGISISSIESTLHIFEIWYKLPGSPTPDGGYLNSEINALH